MTTGQIVAIVVLVLLVAIVVAAVLLRKRSPNVRKAEAAQHRQEAEQRRASAERLEAEANERADRARAEHAQAAKLAEMAAHDREVAEKAAAEAMRLDPDYAEQRPVEQSTRPAVAARPADRQLAARPDSETQADRARQADYNPEPIVGGAAEGKIKPRHQRQAAATEPSGATVHEQAQHAVPVPRPAPDAETQPQRTVGDAVRDRDAADRPAGESGTGTHDRPTLADRIMGRS